MKKSYWTLAIIGISLTLGAELVHENPDCVRLARELRQMVASQLVAARHPKHHSAETLKKWAEWRKAHPNWKPLSTREALAKLNFACTDVAKVLDARAKEEFVVSEEFPAPAPTALFEPEVEGAFLTSEIPTEPLATYENPFVDASGSTGYTGFPSVGYPGGFGGLGGVPQRGPIVVNIPTSEAPELGTFGLVLTGLITVFKMRYRTRRRG